MSLPIALKPAHHPSPWIDDDGDILVSTASTSSEHDPDFDSSTESKEEEKSPRLRSKETQLTVPATPLLKSRMAHSKPMLRSNYELPELPSDPTDEITASPSSSASTSAPSSPASPASPTKFRPANVQLAPLLVNLIDVHQEYLGKFGFSPDTVAQVLAVVSAMPIGLRGNTLIGSAHCSMGLKQALLLVVKAEEKKALADELDKFISNLPSTEEPGRNLLHRLLAEIYRSLTGQRRFARCLPLDATLRGNARWLHGAYKGNPFSVGATLDQALKSGGLLLEAILGEESVKVLKGVAEWLPSDLGRRKHGTPTKNSSELMSAIEQLDEPETVRDILGRAASQVGTDPNQWDKLIREAMRSIREKESQNGERSEIAVADEAADVQAGIRTACITVFKLLQAF